MLVDITKSDEGLLVDYSNVRETENHCESDRYIYFFDSNLTNNEDVILKLRACNSLLDYETINSLFCGNFFIAVYDKNEQEVAIHRDKSGIKTAYIFKSDYRLIFGTNVHQVAKKASVKSFDKGAVYKFLFGDFLFNGSTFYEDVREIRRGGSYYFTGFLSTEFSNTQELVLAKEENFLSEAENIVKLREEIVQAHRGYVSSSNNVLLSGGIDSVAMLIALDDILSKDKITAISYKVKGTLEDETHYAKSIAEHLDIPIEIKEIDPCDPNNYLNFEERLLEMNNPYIGMWIFGNFQGSPNEMFYAGQDTRLHTPSVDPIDRVAFSLVSYRNTWAIRLLGQMASLVRFFIKDWKDSSNNYFKYLFKASYVFEIKKYVNLFFFKLDKDSYSKTGFPMKFYEEIRSYFTLDYSEIKSPRSLYNRIVDLKWNEQYINDIRYLQDIGKANNTYVALPFYLEPIAFFSSTIPFKLAIKSMMGKGRFSNKNRIVKKYMLRQSLRDKMNDLTYYRAKAVSSSLYLLFNGKLGELIKSEIKRDLESKNSFVKEFQIEEIVGRFMSRTEWVVADEFYLLKMYHIGVLAMYNRSILR